MAAPRKTSSEIWRASRSGGFLANCGGTGRSWMIQVAASTASLAATARVRLKRNVAVSEGPSGDNSSHH